MEDSSAARLTPPPSQPRGEAELLKASRKERYATVRKLQFVAATWYREKDALIRTDGREKDAARCDDPEGPEIDGRRRTVGATLSDGSLVAVEDGRSVSWPIDLVREQERIARCESGGVLLWDGERWRPTPMLCGARGCPRCARSRIGRWVWRWMPFFEAAAEDRAFLAQITLTQPTRIARGAVVLPHERHRFVGAPSPGEFGPACGGETLTGSYRRFRDTWESVREDRATKVRWRRALAGCCYGIEWTQRPDPRKARGPQIPRWHCHAHVLVIAPRSSSPWSDPRVTWPQLRRDWCAASDGASPQAQHFQRITGSADQPIATAVLETMKYPFKVGDLSVAGMVEAYASLRGVRPHHVAGALHATSRSSKEDPWARWLACRRDPPSWPRLLFRVHGGEPWSVYNGQHRTGELQWTHGGSAAPIWVADAAHYWEILRSGLGSDDARAGAELADCSAGELEVMGAA